MDDVQAELPAGPCKQCEDTRREKEEVCAMVRRDIDAKVRVNTAIESLLKAEKALGAKRVQDVTVLSAQCNYLFDLLTNTYGVDAQALLSSMPHSGSDKSNGG